VETVCRALTREEVITLMSMRESDEYESAEDRMYDMGSLLVEFGFKRVGQGAFKRVYTRHDINYVVKCHVDWGCNEVENVDSCPDHLRPYLLPVEQHKGFQFQEKLNLEAMSCEDAGCKGKIDGMYDSDSDGCGRNHCHRADGTLVIYDYGQDGQWWSESAYEFYRDRSDNSISEECNCTDCRHARGSITQEEEECEEAA